MKSKIFFILFFTIFNCMFCAFAHQSSGAIYQVSKSELLNLPQQSRMYIQPNQIQIIQDGIFVEIKNELYQVSQICQDENGFFVPHVDFWWTCVNGHPNPPWNAVCWVCGKT